MTKHISVLKNEVIDLLNIKIDGVYFDLTFGGGGHSLEIAQTASKGKVIAFEIDEAAIKRFQENHKQKNIQIVKSNFSDLLKVKEELKLKSVDGILADLGWSTDQLNDIEGMSFEKSEDELDMRFDKDLGVSAKDLLNVLSRQQLKQLFASFADIFGRESNRLVDAIIENRKLSGINKVAELNSLIENEFGTNNGIKAKVYQALRIAVNSEYENLKKMLTDSLNLLEKDGRFLVITFHSGEDAIVEKFFKDAENQNKIEILTKNKNKLYITPSLEELKVNISSRSAKLWGYQKI